MGITSRLLMVTPAPIRLTTFPFVPKNHIQKNIITKYLQNDPNWKNVKDKKAYLKTPFKRSLTDSLDCLPV